MGTTLDISSSSRLLPVSAERKAHLKRLVIKKGSLAIPKADPNVIRMCTTGQEFFLSIAFINSSI